MIDELFIYALSVYALFHVAGRSDLFAKPRNWALRSLPGYLTYPLSCAFCFTIWTGIAFTGLVWLVTGYLSLSHLTLLAAPATNLIVDLVVRVLLKRADPAPVLLTGSPASQQNSLTFTVNANPSIWTVPSISTGGNTQPPAST